MSGERILFAGKSCTAHFSFYVLAVSKAGINLKLKNEFVIM